MHTMKTSTRIFKETHRAGLIYIHLNHESLCFIFSCEKFVIQFRDTSKTAFLMFHDIKNEFSNYILRVQEHILFNQLKSFPFLVVLKNFTIMHVFIVFQKFNRKKYIDTNHIR